MRKTMPFIFIILGLGLIVASVYFYFNNPLKNAPAPSPTSELVVSQRQIEEDQKAQQCYSKDERECNGTEYCTPQYKAGICPQNNGYCTQGFQFDKCTPSNLEEAERNKISTECEKIEGQIIKKNGKLQCMCNVETQNSVVEQDCLADLIHEFQTN